VSPLFVRRKMKFLRGLGVPLLGIGGFVAAQAVPAG
jgi:hypothetical protein